MWILKQNLSVTPAVCSVTYHVVLFRLVRKLQSFFLSNA